MAHLQLAHQLGPFLSVADGASAFVMGEYVLVRIPDEIHVDGYIDDEATDLPPDTSNGSSPQHFVFVRQVTIQSATSYLLEVYPVVSFTSRSARGAKATLIPLSLGHPTPEAFGPPLSFGNFATFTRDSWLLVVPIRFILPASRPFKRMIPSLIMPLSVLFQIDRYRETLHMNTQIANATHYHNQPSPPLNDGNGDGRGSGNIHQGRSGDGSVARAASGVMPVTSPPTIIGGGGGEKAGGAESEEFAIKTAHDGILVLEGVDDDAVGADATMRDELNMLARRGDPMWMKELRKYMQEEERERVQMQEEREMRLAHFVYYY